MIKEGVQRPTAKEDIAKKGSGMEKISQNNLSKQQPLDMLSRKTDVIPLNTEEPQEPLPPLDLSIAKIVDIEVDDVATTGPETSTTTPAVEKIEELSGYCFIDLSILNTAFVFVTISLNDTVNFF